MKQPMSGRFVLTLLFLVSLFNYLDRWMLAILLPDIKSDLNLSDSEIGFISGIAFSLFYALMGIPIARLADRYSRRVIVSTAMAVWSAMTAICGLAQSFWQLALARVMVGVGEAGATPPSHSLISDLYPKDRRAFALAIYALGSPLGIFLGFLLGGWLTQEFGWRVALFSFGIPGLILAFVVFAKLPEPKRGAADDLRLTGAGTRHKSEHHIPAFLTHRQRSGVDRTIWVNPWPWIWPTATLERATTTASRRECRGARARSVGGARSMLRAPTETGPPGGRRWRQQGQPFQAR